jgi:tetratricopeptide (TPR) repeat protein
MRTTEAKPKMDGKSKAAGANSHGHGRLALLLLLAVICMGGAVGLGRWLELRRPANEQATIAEADESLYLNATTARRMSLGFNGLVADWYWMRTLQYVGRKVIERSGQVDVVEIRNLNLKQLAPLLERVVTLDPQFMQAYEYGAMLLPEYDMETAIRFINRGIEANPSEWKLYHHLGYILWQKGRFAEAAEAYRRGAAIPGAMPWMRGMVAQMELKGGSRETARQIYVRMYEEAERGLVKEMARKRLMQLTSLDERDVIRRVLASYRERTGRCPAAWPEIAPALRAARLRTDASGAPLDPSETPYLLTEEGCGVDLDWRSSEVPYR